MVNHCIQHLQSVAARQWRSSRSRLMSLFVRTCAWLSGWWAPRDVLTWLRLCDTELEHLWSALVPPPMSWAPAEQDRAHDGAFTSAFGRQSLALMPAPSTLTTRVMARVRAMPAPQAPFTDYSSPSSQTFTLHPLRVLLAAVSLALLLLGVAVAAATLNPASGVLLLALLVNLLLALLNTAQVAAVLFDAAASNAWIAVPLLVAILGAALLAWSRVTTLIDSAVVEV